MKNKNARFLIRKRSFLLFELLISLTLIVLCLFPLIKPHAFMRVKEKKELMEMQLDHFAEQAYCALKEELYENRCPWSKLVDGQERKLNKEFLLVTGKDSARTLTCCYLLKEIDHCDKRSQNVSGLLLSATLKFSLNSEESRVYERTLYLEGATQG